MDEQNARKKELKRAYKRAKRSNVLLWKVLAIILAVVTVIAIPVNIIVHMFDNTIAAFAGGAFWKLENPDHDAQYFKGDFADEEEMIAMVSGWEGFMIVDKPPGGGGGGGPSPE